jgi:hypothetical protein
MNNWNGIDPKALRTADCEPVDHDIADAAVWRSRNCIIMRVVRGGSWYQAPKALCAAMRTLSTAASDRTGMARTANRRSPHLLP